MELVRTWKHAISWLPNNGCGLENVGAPPHHSPWPLQADQPPLDISSHLRAPHARPASGLGSKTCALSCGTLPRIHEVECPHPPHARVC